MSEATRKTESTTKEMLEELQRVRDELRVQVHLAGMEAKDAFSDLEGKLETFEARAHRVGDEPVAELREGFTHLREAFLKLRENMSS